MDFDFLVVLKLLVQAAGTSVSVFFLTLLFALPLGLAICAGRMSKFRVVSWIFRIYISIMRGTPLVLQLFVAYYGPYYAFGIPLSHLGSNWRFVAVIIAFVLNYAAYFAEIYRSGIASMPVGQYEAARVLGYSRAQTFRFIILPQVVRRILPTITNEVITLIKDTSLAFAIGIVEMFTKAQQLASALHTGKLLAYVLAGVLYYIFNFCVAMGMEKLEKKMNYYSIK